MLSNRLCTKLSCRHTLVANLIRQLGNSSPNLYSAVVIGSDCTGASVAYHLAVGGLKDVVLIEPNLPPVPPVACGLASFFHTDARFKKVHTTSIKLYNELAHVNPGLFNTVGSLRLSKTEERSSELKFHNSRNWDPSSNYHYLDSAAIKTHLPFLKDGLFDGALFTEGDGYVNETLLRKTLVELAKEQGVRVVSPVDIQGVQRTEHSWKVTTDQGVFFGINFVNSAGIHSKQIGKLSKIKLALALVAHPYVVTKPLGLNHGAFPVYHNLLSNYYIRPEGDAVLVGCVNTTPGHDPILHDFTTNGCPKDFSYSASSSDESALRNILSSVSEAAPGLGQLEPHQFLYEPLNLTPDGYPLVGPLNGQKNYWIAAGFGGPCSLTAGGIGKYLAQYVITGEPPFELTAVEPNRYTPWAFNSRNFVVDKVRETYQLQYATTDPNKAPERPAGRPTHRVSGLYGSMLKLHGKMAMRSGWEQCNYFASDGDNDYQSIINRECGYVMNSAGIIDLSIYGKLEVRGKESKEFMNYVFASEIPKENMMGIGFALTPKGKLFSRVRIIHYIGSQDEHCYLLMVRPEMENRDFGWLHKLKDEKNFDVNIGNVTEYLGCVGIMGPASMDILSALTRSTVNDQTHPHKSANLFRLSTVPCIACRDSTTGELGWHLYHGRADSLNVYQQLMNEGKAYGVGNFGRYAFNALRIEKGEKFWGHELTLDYNPVEAGITDQLNLNKEYVGSSDIKEIVSRPPSRRLVLLELDDVSVTGVTVQGHDPDGLEAVTVNGELVGHTTSGCFGYNIQKFICFAYIDSSVRESDQMCVQLYNMSVPARVLDHAPIKPHHLRTEVDEAVAQN